MSLNYILALALTLSPESTQASASGQLLTRRALFDPGSHVLWIEVVNTGTDELVFSPSQQVVIDAKGRTTLGWARYVSESGCLLALRRSLRPGERAFLPIDTERQWNGTDEIGISVRIDIWRDGICAPSRVLGKMSVELVRLQFSPRVRRGDLRVARTEGTINVTNASTAPGILMIGQTSMPFSCLGLSKFGTLLFPGDSYRGLLVPDPQVTARAVWGYPKQCVEVIEDASK